MRYDRCVVATIVILGFGKMAYEGFLTPAHWMFWTTLFYMKMVYGLLSFPFLVFSVPLVGKGMHHAHATAYDQSGTLVPKLSSSLMKKKKAIDDRERARAKERKIRKKQLARQKARNAKIGAARREERLSRRASAAAATVKERSLALGAQARGYLPLKEERDTVGGADAAVGDNQAPRPGDVELGIDMTEETVRAATKVQAIMRGRKARSTVCSAMRGYEEEPSLLKVGQSHRDPTQPRHRPSASDRAPPAPFTPRHPCLPRPSLVHRRARVLVVLLQVARRDGRPLHRGHDGRHVRALRAGRRRGLPLRRVAADAPQGARARAPHDGRAREARA